MHLHYSIFLCTLPQHRTPISNPYSYPSRRGLLLPNASTGLSARSMGSWYAIFYSEFLTCRWDRTEFAAPNRHLDKHSPLFGVKPSLGRQAGARLLS